jgi:hypothetical protein
VQNNTSIALLFAFLSWVPVAALAQAGGERHPLLENDFTLSVGGYLPSKEVKLRVDGSSPGEAIDFEERVNVVSDDTTAAVDFRWRFGEKWSVSGQYWKTSDSNTAELIEDITWEDYTFKQGSSVSAGVSLTVARVFFGRSFSRGERHEFGLGAGLHWLEIGAFIEGEVFVNDESSGFRRESVSAHAPLPNIGGWYWYAFSPRWLLKTRVDWLSASIGDYSGGLWNAHAGINFQPWRNLGFGLAYQYFAIDVDVSKSNWGGGADLSFRGPFLSLNASW